MYAVDHVKLVYHMVNSELSSMNISQNFACSSYKNTTHFAIFEK